MNNVVLVGRLKGAVETKALKTGSVSTFRLEVESGKNRNGEVVQDEISCEAWNKKELENLADGTVLALVGKIKQSTWEAEDGSPRERLYVRSVTVQPIFNESKEDEATYPENEEMISFGKQDDESDYQYD